MILRDVRGLALAIALALVAVACAAPEPIPADHYYRLSAMPRAAEVRLPIEGTLYVPVLDAAGVYAERPVLLSDPSATELVQRRYDFWAEPPARLLQHALVDYLRARATGSGRVTASRPRGEVASVLRGRIVRFDLERAGETYVPVVTLGFELTDPTRGTVLSDTFEARGRAGSIHRALGPDGFSALVAELFGELAESAARPLSRSAEDLTVIEP